MSYNDFLKYKEENYYCKVPKLWKLAMENFAKYSQPTYLDSSNRTVFGYGCDAPNLYAHNTQPLTQEQIQKLHTISEVLDILQRPTQSIYEDPNSIAYRPKIKRPKEILHPDKIDFSTIELDKLYEMMVLADRYNQDCMSELERMQGGFRRFVFFTEVETENGIEDLTLEELDEVCQEWRIDAQITYYRIYSGEFLIMHMIEQRLEYLKLFESWVANNILPNSDKAKEQYNALTKKWDKFFNGDDEEE